MRLTWAAAGVLTAGAFWPATTRGQSLSGARAGESPALTGAAGVVPIVVRPERPRIFFRAKAWDGPSLEKARAWMQTAEYRRRAEALPRTPIGNALLYLLTDDQAAGKKAVEGLGTLKAGLDKALQNKESPSYTGIEVEQLAAMYDWLHGHPGFDDGARKAAVALLEEWGDRFMAYLKAGGPTPFYSRIPGALAGLTLAGLSLYGDSPKAEAYVTYAAWYLREKLGTIRQAEDGATGGATYGLHHEFTDLANLVAAWRSATGFDAARWIAERQGDWLRRQMLFQIWTTYPNGWMVKDGDVWSNSHADKYEYRMQIDAITGMYRSGVGRTWANLMGERWGGLRDYYFTYVWEFFVFNDPEVPPRPLSDLGRAAVFSPGLHGYVCWRDSWEPDATVIHFKCGETVDHHATYDQGKFTIFKRTPLAIKNGGYLGGYRGTMHMYYKSPWSANCVVFTGPNAHGHQPYIDFDGFHSWAEWKTERLRRYKRPPTGVLLETESNERFARALGDLTGASPPGTTWLRELVFLGYRYLLVLDRVEAGPGITHRWLLHTINAPSVEGNLILADNGPARLFCRTLLPEGARLVTKSGKGHEYRHLTQKGEERVIAQPDGRPYDKFDPKRTPPEQQLGEGRVDVEPPEGGGETATTAASHRSPPMTTSRRSLYLNVLFPTDTATQTMPPCSVERRGEDLVVTVGDLQHTFKAPAAPGIRHQ